jgi:hypothetical protein
MNKYSNTSRPSGGYHGICKVRTLIGREQSS